MRTLHAIALAAGTLLAALAQAAPQAAPQPASEQAVPETTVRITGTAQRKRPSSEELKDFKGTYLLSNGKNMTVIARGKRMYAEIDGMPRVELNATGPNAFSAGDTGMTVTFNETIEGRRNDVVIRARPGQLG
jgi:hypothetical protein